MHENRQANHLGAFWTLLDRRMERVLDGLSRSAGAALLTLRYRGEGEAGIRGAAPGDLYVFLSVAAHRLFQRNGADVFCRAPIPMTTAALGGAIEVPTIDGARAKINVPSGTQTNRQFRLKGKGMKVLRSNARGDMYVEVNVETPVNLTKRQQELLREFETAGKGRKTSPESEGFFARVKEFWEDLTE